ncbi:hypothetical protein [Psychrobacter pygoscelis]|uniref:hypothetical protein n=1 Tax=Psychrobacter pygoscelis TaxID=2488563 RepID=UPI00103F2D53|nr:hypothetical protein [Psychrobacter pygoscelis]
MKNRNLVAIISTLSAAILLSACGGSEDGTSVSPKYSGTKNSSVPKDVVGYYETIVTADNGDDILVNLMVKPNGEYIGFYNNSFVNGKYTYNQEVFSLIAGQLESKSDKKLYSQVREFDSTAKTIRNYRASVQYVPSSRLTLDLSNSDASIDKKVYDLKYIKLNHKSLANLTGSYRGSVGTLTKYNFGQADISNTNRADTKRLTINMGKYCQFSGTIKDEGYQQDFYPFSGTLSGASCPMTGKFEGIVLQRNNTVFINGVNAGRTQVFRFNSLSKI